MKKIFNFIFMAAAIAAMSCVKEENPVGPGQNGELVHMTFTATADAETKVAFTDGATVWTEGDKIMVIAESGKAYEFEATSVDGANAIFEGDAEPSEKYYAVSPASAYKGNDIAAPTNEEKGGRLYVNIPETQTAVAGSFDKSAFVSTATNNGDMLNFKNICNVAKFKFKNADDIKSIRFKMTSNTNLAGTGNIYIKSLTSHAWGDDIKIDGQSIRYSKDMITLNAPAEGFQANTDYYFVQRVYQQSTDGKNADGVQFYIEYENKISVIEGTSAFDASRNSIIPLGTIDTNAKLRDVTPYEAYNLGFDIMVARKPLNIKNNGAATLISTHDKTITSNGVYFINSDVTVTLNPASGHYTSLYVIGNDTDAKPQMAVGGNVRWAANGSISLKGLKLIDLDNNTKFQSGGANGTLLIDECSLPTPNNSQLIYLSHDTEALAIYNSDMKVTATNKYILHGNSKTIQTCTMQNNIVYSPEGDIAQFKFIQSNPTIKTFNFCKNTIANVYASTTTNETYCTLTAVANYTCDNNLFYMPNYSDGRYSWIIKILPEATLSANNNFLYKTESASNRIRYQLEQSSNAAYISTKTTEADLVTQIDLANGVIVPATTAGATR